MTESVQIFMEKDRLQPLADNIKVLKGSDTITLQQMEDTIEETNTDIASQTDLIAQLASALQGKSVPGGSGSVETCNVSITNKRFVMPMMTYTALIDGVIQTVVLAGIASGATTNIECIKGTKVIVSEKNYAYQSGLMITTITGGITFDKFILYSSGAASGIYTITGDGTLTLTNDS